MSGSSGQPITIQMPTYQAQQQPVQQPSMNPQGKGAGGPLQQQQAQVGTPIVQGNTYLKPQQPVANNPQVQQPVQTQTPSIWQGY